LLDVLDFTAKLEKQNQKTKVFLKCLFFEYPKNRRTRKIQMRLCEWHL